MKKRWSSKNRNRMGRMIMKFRKIQTDNKMGRKREIRKRQK